jgi:glycolate oxidase FAD binding subunit
VTTILQPGTAGEVADALRTASESRQSIVIRGSGSKSDWGRPPGRIDAVLDMRRLNRVLAHEHGDMTATIEAGATLREVNEVLARHGQTLPLDPPFADRATIGGLLATNDSGPLRHRYGAPRDLVIGVQLATTDGVVSKAGGRVVKNVAGYDLSRLVTGSFGSLAAIVSATFKLSPLPAASKTMRVTVFDGDAVGEVVRVVMASQLEPIAFELIQRSTQDARNTQSTHLSASSANSAFHLLLRFASLPAVVDAQVAQGTAMLRDCANTIDVFADGDERALWQAHATQIWEAPGAVVRASWLPAHIADALEREPFRRAGEARLKASLSLELVGRAAIGAGHVGIDGDTDAQAAAIEQFRASAVFGNVVIVRGSAELKARVDVWGPQGDRQHLFESLKRAFDPHGVLNAGRGPL